MLSLFARLPQMLAASSLLLSGVAFADPPTSTARDAAHGLPTGKRMHKPIVAAAEAPTPSDDISARSVSCVTTNVRTGIASDPEEGGQIAKAGKASGKASLQPFTVTHKTDKSSPILMDNNAPGNDCH